MASKDDFSQLRRPLSETAPDLLSLDLLTTIVRLGSVSAAAAAHGVSQPSASSRIMRLERQIGVRLLDRSPGGSVPTAEGALIAAWADSVLTAMARVDVATAALRKPRGRVLRAAVGTRIASDFLPDWLIAWQRVGGRKIAATAMEDAAVLDLVRNGGSALGFVEGRSRIRGVGSRVLGTTEQVLIAPAGHAWTRRRKPATAAQLEAIDPTEAGDVRLASRRSVAADLSSGHLVEVPVDDIDLTVTLRAVWPPDQTPDETVSAFIDIAAG